MSEEESWKADSTAATPNTMSSSAFPDTVRQLLKNSSFLHLATCEDNIPHVSLMNYTFIEGSTDYSSDKDLILITTPTKTKKFQNLESNNKCSILIHDWITNNNANENNVLNFLQNINQTEIGDKSVTLHGHVIKYILDPSSESYEYFKKIHLEKHPNAKCFIEGDNIAFLLIKIDESQVADSNNHVENFK